MKGIFLRKKKLGRKRSPEGVSSSFSKSVKWQFAILPAKRNGTEPFMKEQERFPKKGILPRVLGGAAPEDSGRVPPRKSLRPSIPVHKLASIDRLPGNGRSFCRGEDFHASSAGKERSHCLLRSWHSEG